MQHAGDRRDDSAESRPRGCCTSARARGQPRVMQHAGDRRDDSAESRTRGCCTSARAPGQPGVMQHAGAVDVAQVPERLANPGLCNTPGPWMLHKCPSAWPTRGYATRRGPARRFRGIAPAWMLHKCSSAWPTRGYATRRRPARRFRGIAPAWMLHKCPSAWPTGGYATRSGRGCCTSARAPGQPGVMQHAGAVDVAQVPERLANPGLCNTPATGETIPRTEGSPRNYEVSRRASSAIVFRNDAKASAMWPLPNVWGVSRTRAPRKKSESTVRVVTVFAW